MGARAHEFDDFGKAITIFLDVRFTAVFSVTSVLNRCSLIFFPGNLRQLHIRRSYNSKPNFLYFVAQNSSTTGTLSMSIRVSL